MIPQTLTTIATRLSRSWMRLRKNNFARLIAVFIVLLAFWPLPERARRPHYARVVTASDGSLLKAYLPPDHKWRFRTNVKTLPAHVVAGLKCLEDRRFAWHPGVDPIAALRAAVQNVRAGRVVSGASTLTMQVARLLEPKPRRWVSKIRESVRALQLELHLSKREILELYLAYAPFGGNVEGIEAASFRHFGKPAQALNPAEAAFLFMLPQSPKRWQARDQASLSKLRNHQLDRMQACEVISGDDLVKWKQEPIPLWRGDFSKHAEHFADAAVKLRTDDRLTTTIDADLQRALEELVGANESRLRELNIVNAGVVVVDNASGEVRAAIGNFEHARNGDSQKFATFLVPRSTGSLLKPFLYGRLLETGDLLAETLLEDVPLELDGYHPQNYNGEFHGLVEARMALAHSYNVPWIRALKDHGVNPFYTFLLSSGLKTPQKPDDVGVSLIVGGMQANLMDLTMLFRALADDGQMRALSWFKEESGSHKPWAWLNPGAAHLVREALKIRGRPDFAIDPRYLSNPSIRWKTGTSQGNRDAWAIGFDPDFTVGVWLGNLDQTPAPGLVGPEVAAPLLFDTFSRLRKQAPQMARTWEPSHTEMTDVCAFSGLPAGPACPHSKTVLGIAGLALRKRCPYHQHILIDSKTGLQITRECERPGMNAVVRSALDLPPDVADWTARQMTGLQLSPAFHPACLRRPVALGGLQILSPEPKTYVLHRAEAETEGPDTRLMRLPLRLKTATASGRWSCFLNGEGLPTPDTAEEAQLRVAPGSHSVVCADEQGRADEVRFSVEL